MRPTLQQPIRYLAAVAILAAAAYTQDTPDADHLIAEARRRLAEHGYEVPAQVHAAERTHKQVLADLEAQQDLFLPDGFWDVQYALFRGFDLTPCRDAEAFRHLTVKGMSNGLSAYYDPLQQQFVLLATATRRMNDALAGDSLPMVLHELVHAVQDARPGGLRHFFDGDHSSLDASQARRCALEGEAELVAIATLRGEEALQDDSVLIAVRDLEQAMTGELTGLVYDSGRRIAFHCFHEGGWDAVRGLWSAPPTSTEQALHPHKLGRDLPTEVTVPEVAGLSRLGATTVGELMILNVLRQAGVDKLDAHLAAAGWDGDQLVLFDSGEEDDPVLAWRSLWDRDEDAADFAVRLQKLGKGEVARAGRMVDWVRCGDADVRARILAACAAARTVPAAVAADAASTVAAEVEVRADHRQSTSDGKTWRFDEVGLSVPIPEGWGLREFHGMKLLFPKGGQRPGAIMNVSVNIQARGQLEDLQQMGQLNRQQLEKMKLTIDSLVAGKLGEVEVLCGEYHGAMGQPVELHFLSLMYLRGERQVAVCVTASEATWKTKADALRALLAGVTVAPEAGGRDR